MSKGWTATLVIVAIVFVLLVGYVNNRDPKPQTGRSNQAGVGGPETLERERALEEWTLFKEDLKRAKLGLRRATPAETQAYGYKDMVFTRLEPGSARPTIYDMNHKTHIYDYLYDFASVGSLDFKLVNDEVIATDERGRKHPLVFDTGEMKIRMK